MYLNLSVANPATLDTLGLLVLDEAQFIIGPQRGIVVELLLTNVLAARERGISPQIVALSAVVGNENGFDEWLGASKLVTTLRPVPLVEGVLDRAGLFQFLAQDGIQHQEQLLPRYAIVQRKEKPGSQDVIVPLVRHLVSANPAARVIVFRNSRGTAEGCARYLAADLRLPAADDVIAALPAGDLSNSSQALHDCLQGGTAFHNANLSREERVAIERGFSQRDGNIKILAATTTVAAGINTPASTVILAEHEFIGEENQPFTIAEYKNMAGRAGRVGYHETGQAIILADTALERDTLFRRYVLGKPEPIRSSFQSSDLDTWLLRLLSQVKRIPRDAVVKLLASTYGGYLATKADPTWHERTINDLENLLRQMIALGLVDEEPPYVRLTLLGRACGNSSLRFRSALRFVRTLRARETTAMTAEHLMVLVQALPELDALHTPLMKRGSAENRWPQQVHAAYTSILAHALQEQADDNWAYCARCKRAIVMRYWITGTPMQVIEHEATTNAFQGKIAAGHVRGIADATRFHLRSAANIAALVLLANGPDPTAVDVLLKQLETGLPTDALPLLDLPLNLSRGEYLVLHNAALNSVNSIRAASADTLAKLLGTHRAEALTKLLA